MLTSATSKWGLNGEEQVSLLTVRAGPVRSRLAPLDLLGPFVLRTAGSVFSSHAFHQLIFSLSHAIPQFKLLSLISSL